MLRQYDEAVLKLLSAELDGEAVPIRFATPRREYGVQRTETGVASSARDNQLVRNQTVALPALSVQRLGFTASVDRRNLNRHRYLGWSDDLNLVYGAQHPAAWDVGYQLDIYTKFREDANRLTELTLAKFPRLHRGMTVNFGHPWGPRRVYLKVGQVSDNSDLEPGEQGDREVRMTVDFVLEAWVLLGWKSTRTVRIQEVRYDLYWDQDTRGVDAVGIARHRVER